MAVEVRGQAEGSSPETVDVPAPTAAPIVLAFGLFLLFAGVATSAAVSGLGVLATVAGSVGWFRAVLPREARELVPKQPPPPPVDTERREVARLLVSGTPGRAWFPAETYPVSAGLKGGLAGGFAMSLLAMLYGAVKGHGIWYPINLLSAGFFPSTVTATTAELSRFQMSAFAVACTVHLLASVLVGLLYGAMLPMLPRRPIVLAGIAAPVLWSGLLHSIAGIINPVFNQRVDWLWFVLSQVGFGIVAGIIVTRQERVRTMRGLPLYVRAGLEASGLEPEPAGKGQDP